MLKLEYDFFEHVANSFPASHAQSATDCCLIWFTDVSPVSQFPWKDVFLKDVSRNGTQNVTSS